MQIKDLQVGQLVQSTKDSTASIHCFKRSMNNNIIYLRIFYINSKTQECVLEEINSNSHYELFEKPVTFIETNLNFSKYINQIQLTNYV